MNIGTHETTMFNSRLVVCDAQVMSAWHGQYRLVPNPCDSFNNNTLRFILLSTTTRLGKTLAANRQTLERMLILEILIRKIICLCVDITECFPIGLALICYQNFDNTVLNVTVFFKYKKHTSLGRTV